MKTLFPLLLSLFILCDTSCQEKNTSDHTGNRNYSFASWECSGAWKEDMPGELTWETNIAPEEEPGEQLEVSGRIFHPDGTTPAENVILYLYHTDSEGNYSRGKSQDDCARRHGLLRGWIKTGKNGRYKFSTIRPASYPGTREEQHIHAVIKEPDLPAYWIQSFKFDDDPFLTDEAGTSADDRGGTGLLHVTRNGDGIWTGHRDIILGKHVPGYPSK